jgi:FkbM family methyltransferase
MKITPFGAAVLENDTHASRDIERLGTLYYEEAIAKIVMPMIHPGDVCVDAGAFIGAYASGMKRACGDSGRVLAFEPNPEAFECLKFNCPDCEVHMQGLGDMYCEHGMIIRREENAGSTWFVRGLDLASSNFIELDSLELDRLDFYKLDVEGMEPLALAGSLSTIARCRPIIYLEVNHSALLRQSRSYVDILDILLPLAYRPQFADPRHNFREREWTQPDVFFIP